jgi:biotin carboxyl carrier protein
VTLEAMKMEHVVVAPMGGRIVEIGVRPGDQVVRGQPLGAVEPSAIDPPAIEPSAIEP